MDIFASPNIRGRTVSVKDEAPGLSQKQLLSKKMYFRCILILWFQQDVNKSIIIIWPNFFYYSIIMLHVSRKRRSSVVNNV